LLQILDGDTTKVKVVGNGEKWDCGSKIFKNSLFKVYFLFS